MPQFSRTKTINLPVTWSAGTSVTPTINTNTALLAANSNRVALRIYNNSSVNTAYVYANGDTTNPPTPTIAMPILPSQSLIFQQHEIPTGAITCSTTVVGTTLTAFEAVPNLS